MSKTCLVGPDTGMFFYSYYFGFGPCQQERLRFFFFTFLLLGIETFLNSYCLRMSVLT